MLRSSRDATQHSRVYNLHSMKHINRYSLSLYFSFYHFQHSLLNGCQCSIVRQKVSSFRCRAPHTHTHYQNKCKEIIMKKKRMPFSMVGVYVQRIVSDIHPLKHFRLNAIFLMSFVFFCLFDATGALCINSFAHRKKITIRRSEGDTSSQLSDTRECTQKKIVIIVFVTRCDTQRNTPFIEMLYIIVCFRHLLGR